VTGVLRGFDPFMNLVIDEAVEECKTGEKNHIGMVVCDLVFLHFVQVSKTHLQPVQHS